MASDDSIEDEFGICEPCDGPAGCQSAQRCLGPSVGRVPYWHDRALAAEDRAERERLDAIVLEARAVAAEAERDEARRDWAMYQHETADETARADGAERMLAAAEAETAELKRRLQEAGL